MYQKLNIPPLGIVENMSYFQCPKCNERTHIFSHGGGATTAANYGVPFLGEVPLNVSLREGGDLGKPIVAANPNSPVAQAFRQIAEKVAAQVSIANLKSQDAMIIE
jgi:ATP-binding protein involved in chromosome partitioning